MMNPVSRRRFLQQTTELAAAAAVCGHSALLQAAAAARPVPGLQLYTIQNDIAKDPGATLRQVAAMGYKEVEAVWFMDPRVPAANRPTASEFRKLIDDAGLRCPSAHLPFGFSATANPLQDAHALRVEYVVSSLLPPTPPSMSDISKLLDRMNRLTLDDFRQMAALANRIGKEARSEGFRYAYHNHNFEFRDQGGRRGYDILLSETDPAYVEFEADCGWMIVAGADPVALMEQHPGRFCMIHVKDFKPSNAVVTVLGPNPEVQPTELGRGHIDYRPIVAAARKAGVSHYFVEQEPPIVGMTPLEAAKVDCDYLRKVLAERSS